MENLDNKKLDRKITTEYDASKMLEAALQQMDGIILGKLLNLNITNTINICIFLKLLNCVVYIYKKHLHSIETNIKNYITKSVKRRNK